MCRTQPIDFHTWLTDSTMFTVVKSTVSGPNCTDSVYACICMRVYVCMCMYVCVCVYVCMYMYVCMYVCMYVYVCVCIHVCVCMHNILGGIVRGGKCPTQSGRGNCPGELSGGGELSRGIVLHPSTVVTLCINC